MTRSNAFYSICAELEDLLIDEQALKESIANTCDRLRTEGGATKDDLWAVKRVLKAQAKGGDALDKLMSKGAAQDEIYSDLIFHRKETGKNISGKSVSDTPHDPDTGEIHEPALDTDGADEGLEGRGCVKDLASAPAFGPLTDGSEGQDTPVQDFPTAHPHEGERGASATSHDDVSRVQSGVYGIGATNSGNPSQSSDDILGDDPLGPFRREA